MRDLPQRFVYQLVDVVAHATPEVFDVEPTYRPGRPLMPRHVQAEIGRQRILPRDDVILAGSNDPAAARTLVDDDGRLGHRHQSFYLLAYALCGGGSATRTRVASLYWTRPDSGGGLADGSTRASPAIGSSARWAAGAVGFVVQRADVVVADGQVAQFVAVGLV